MEHLAQLNKSSSESELDMSEKKMQLEVQQDGTTSHMRIFGQVHIQDNPLQKITSQIQMVHLP